jgi:hypothetical protein
MGNVKTCNYKIFVTTCPPHEKPLLLFPVISDWRFSIGVKQADESAYELGRSKVF